jgi:hypothetical protein
MSNKDFRKYASTREIEIAQINDLVKSFRGKAHKYRGMSRTFAYVAKGVMAENVC